MLMARVLLKYSSMAVETSFATATSQQLCLAALKQPFLLNDGQEEIQPSGGPLISPAAPDEGTHVFFHALDPLDNHDASSPHRTHPESSSAGFRMQMEDILSKKHSTSLNAGVGMFSSANHKLKEEPPHQNPPGRHAFKDIKGSDTETL